MMRAGETPWFGSQPVPRLILNGNAKLRVAVGVFHEIERLHDAINGLTVAGCSEGDIVLLCEPNAMKGRLDKAFGTNPDAGGSSIRLLVRDAGERSTALPPHASNGHSNTSLTQDQILHFETWIDAYFADGLDHQLKRGGCLLLCPVLSPESELTVSKVLLSHSAGPVQLHDIRSAV